jgi:GGDEF domain-containing protein
VLRRSLRNNDVIARYLADRFALLLPEIAAEGLQVVLNKLEQNLATIRTNGIGLSAHWAMAKYPQDGSTELELLKTLVGRLEAAKRQSSGAGAT